MKNKLTNQHSPEEIAEKIMIANSYEGIIRQVKLNFPIKEIKNIREDIKLQFIGKSKAEILEFHNEMTEQLGRLEMQMEKQKLRNEIFNKKIKIKLIDRELNKD